MVTSGGSAPGMNTAIRAIVRLASLNDFQVLGFERGWEGLLTNTYRSLTPRAVGGILHLGGTILFTSKCQDFRKKEGVTKAAETLRKTGTDGLVVIGGNGSFRGALELSRETATVIIGIPATIDNDVYGTDETIGFDTVVNTAISEIDRIRDTLISHERTCIVKVMGKRGFLALTVGLTAGADIILVPEVKYSNATLIKTLTMNATKGKKSSIIIAAEGTGDVYQLAEEIKGKTGVDVRISSNYAQRGGNPTARSRFLANLFAKKAVELLVAGHGNQIVGIQQGVITSINLAKSCGTEKPLDLQLLRLVERLAT